MHGHVMIIRLGISQHKPVLVLQILRHAGSGTAAGQAIAAPGSLSTTPITTVRFDSAFPTTYRRYSTFSKRWTYCMAASKPLAVISGVARTRAIGRAIANVFLDVSSRLLKPVGVEISWHPLQHACRLDTGFWD